MINQKNYNFDKYLIPSNFDIKKTIMRLNKYGLKIVCVVDKNNIIKGTVSDGDIRRGLLKNISLEDSIKEIMNKRPKTVGLKSSNQEVNNTFAEYEVQALPVIDKKEKLLNILTKDRENYIENYVYIIAGGKGKE